MKTGKSENRQKNNKEKSREKMKIKQESDRLEEGKQQKCQ
jgi:hypothetical protein